MVAAAVYEPTLGYPPLDEIPETSTPVGRVRIPASRLLVGDYLTFANRTVITIDPQPANRLQIVAQRTRSGTTQTYIWTHNTPIWIGSTQGLAVRQEKT